MKSGVARKKIDDFDLYKDQLNKSFRSIYVINARY